mgnify:CR=1 FL=1
MKKLRFLRSILPLLLVMWGMLSASAQSTITDVLTNKTFVATSNSYKDFSGKTASSTAVYAGNSATSYGAIQLRSSNSNSGIVTTASGGKAVSITVTWDSSTSASRKLDIYGKNSAYTSATNLYSSSTQGTKLGSLQYSATPNTLTISGDYEYIGIRSNSGALYADEIKIVWAVAGQATVSVPSISPAGGNVAEGSEVTIDCDTEGATIYYALNAADPETATGTVYTAPLTINSDCTITAWAEKSDMTASARVTKAFKAYPEVAYKKANAIISGQKYIFFATNAVATPLTGNYGYMNTVSATDNAGVVNQLGTLNAFTFKAVDGGYTIQDEAGKYYYLSGTYDSFNVSATAPTDGSQIWTVERQGDGTFVVKNSLKNKFVQFTTYNTYGAYADLQAGAVLPVLYTNGDPGEAETKKVQELAFSASEVYNVLGEPFTAPTLSGAKTAVTYESSNPAVATVDAAGVVTVVGIGATVITASAEGTDEYYSASAEYRLVVSEPGVIWAEDFSSNDLSGYGIVNGGSDTKLYDDELATGTAPEILIGKSTGSMEVNIGDLQGLHGRFLLTFKSNNGISAITTTTEGVKIGKINFYKPNGSCEITVPRGVTTLNLKFKNTKSSNTRVDDFKLVHAGYSLTISQYGYSTFGSPKAYVVPEGLEGAIVTVNNTTADLNFVYTEGDIVPAGTGLLFKGTANAAYNIDLATSVATETYTENCMKAFLQDAALTVPADTKAYIFANDSQDGLGFYLQGDGSVLNLSYGKAYLALPASLASQLKGFRLNLGDVTGISGVALEEAAATGVYNLSGVCVGKTLQGLPAGLYIVGGKKVIVK